MTITASEAKTRADRMMLNQVAYNQNKTTSFGLSDGTWRCDCSGMLCAVAKLSGGIDCASTYELLHSKLITPIYRTNVIPFRSCTLVTAEDGFPFGHVALIIDYDRKTDRLRIQEHGGGLGPIRRTLPPGRNYDDVERYGRSRPFQLYNVNNITGTVDGSPATPSTPGTPTKWPWPQDHYIGPVEWDEKSHGGYYPAERPMVAAYKRLIGADPTINFTVNDLAKSLAWQKRAIASGKLKGISPTGKCGPKTWAATGL